MKRYIAYIIFFNSIFITTFSQNYLTKVHDFTPAPGQYINTIIGKDSSSVSILGEPNANVITLGFFGGYVVAEFDAPVANHPDNPYGVDFTVFGNGHTGNSEAGIVQVMKDENKNGLPDDVWYEIAGSSHIFDTIDNYKITYTNPNSLSDIPWTDNKGGSGVVKYMKDFHTQNHYPLPENFPTINQTSYTLEGTNIESKTYQGNITMNIRRDYGYADNTVKNYNVDLGIPDNPYTEEVEGCGGDAFDINWAFDSNGDYVLLDTIHFIRIYCANSINAKLTGDVSTEVAGAAAVTPNKNLSGVTEMIVTNHPKPKNMNMWDGEYELGDNETFQFKHSVRSFGRPTENQNITWSVDNDEYATITEDGLLTPLKLGKVEVIATWNENTSIKKTLVINLIKSVGIYDKIINSKITIFPNPSSNYINVSVTDAIPSLIQIYDITGRKIIESVNSRIPVNQLRNGHYIIKITTIKGIGCSKFIVNK